jgi:hypothetical protein
MTTSRRSPTPRCAPARPGARLLPAAARRLVPPSPPSPTRLAQVREETELYLRQLESEGQVEQVYGKGVQLLTPKPEFAIKSKNTRDGAAAFVNFCSSDKVRPALPRIQPGLQRLQGAKPSP